MKLAPSIVQLYKSDPAIRSYTAACLKNRFIGAIHSPSNGVHLKTSAFQLALCYVLGFGVVKDDSESLALINQMGMRQADLELAISEIRDSYSLSYEEGMFTKFFDLISTTEDDVPRYRDHEELDAVVREYRREIETLTSVIGNSHRITLGLSLYLSRILLEHGDWKGAEEIASELLKNYQDTMGMEHLGSLKLSLHLSSIYQSQGRWVEAETLQTSVLRLQQKLLGSNHPDTIRTMHQLALTFVELERWKVAEELQEVVVQASANTFGSEHRETLRCVSTLVYLSYRQGKLEQAAELATQTLERKIRILGRNHPESLQSMSDLTLLSTTSHEEKEAQYRHDVRISQELLGEKCLETLVSIANLAGYLFERAKLEEAEQLQRRVVDVSCEVWGKEHPNRLSSLANLANIIGD